MSQADTRTHTRTQIKLRKKRINQKKKKKKLRCSLLLCAEQGGAVWQREEVKKAERKGELKRERAE